MLISRRDALKGGAAAAAAFGLQACGGGSLAPPAPANVLYDLIVVGAGIAGISAAKTATSYGANVLVLEAQGHIGGRTLTDNTTFSEIGFDLGAQFFQACLSGNELFQIAQAQGLTLLAAAGSGPPNSLGQAITIGTHDAGPDKDLFAATALAIKSAIFTGGAAIEAGAPDAPISSVVSSLSGLPWYVPVLSQAVIEISGGVDRSLLDLYTYSLLQPVPFAVPGDDYIVKSGLGNFVVGLARGLNIVTNAPVSAIVTGGSSVAVTAGGTTYRAKSVVVTASAAVLAKSNAPGGISFTPPLPASYINAFAALPLTPVYKALLGFKPGFTFNSPGVTPSNAFSVVVPLTNTEISTFFPDFWGTNTVEFIANGDLARTLDAAGNAGAVPILLAQLEQTFPGATAAFDGRITGSSWMSNPYVLGAYSAALPGQFQARNLIAQPIAGQLWFAGEAATTAGARGLILGAYRTGAAAASAALKLAAAPQ